MSQSESDFVIDWRVEPTTEREMLVRVVLLRNALSDSLKLISLRELLSFSAGGDLHPNQAASDFRAAYAQAQEEMRASLQAEHRLKLEKAIRELNGGP